MSGGKQPSSLASFSYDWVGGDIHGLSRFAGTMYGYMPEIEGVVKALDAKVDQIVHDAGWSGDAADGFRKAWESDSLGATALSGAIEQIGQVVDTLAVNLANFEHALEEAADEARAAGVPVGDDGKPPTMPDGPYAVNSAGAKAQATATSYASFYQETMGLAQDARVDASTSLEGLYQQIAPSSSATSGLTTSNKVSLADYLRGFWAVPSANRKAIEESVEKLGTKADEAKAAWVAARDARPNPHVKMPQDVKDALREARSDLAGAKNELASAEASESKWIGSKVVDMRVSDLLKVFGRGAGGAAKSADSLLAKLVKAGEDIPVIDAGAALLGGGIDAYNDYKNGQPWYEAVPEDMLSNVAGVAAGAGAGTLATAGVTAGATALGVAGAPVIGVTAGAAVGGVVAIGVCDFGENLAHEDWGGDIHKYGVVEGIGDGIADSGKKTVKDLGHMASSAWHSVTSIF